MKKRQFFIIVFFVSLALGMTQLIYVPTVRAEQPKRVRLGYISKAAELPIYVAKEKGYFREEGLEIELFSLGLKEEMDALIRGDIDIIPVTSLIVPFQVHATEPGLIKIFNPGGIPGGDDQILEAIIASNNASISSLEDLSGKTIGVPSGPIDKYLLIIILKAVGLDPTKDSIRIETVSREIIGAAYIAGKFDAVYLVQPHLASIMASTESHYVTINPRAKYIMNPFWSGAGAVTTDYIKRNPTVFLSFLNAIDKAIDYVRQYPQEANKLLPKYMPLEEQLTSQVGIYFRKKSTEEVDISYIQRVANTFFEAGVLEKKINVKEFYLTRDEISR